MSPSVTFDDAALTELVKRHHDRVYRYGVRVCASEADADDAVQEAFLILARKPEVRESASLVAWLFTVVKRACMGLLRPFARQRRHLGSRVDDELPLPDEGADPETLLERWRLVTAVHGAIASLDPPLRDVLVLRDLEGLSGDEASKLLGISEEAMKSRLFRAREKLRAHVRDAKGGP